MKLKAETGSLEPRRQGHGVGGGKLAGHADFIGARLKENGELTLKPDMEPTKRDTL